jgi:alpha-1,3-rhamnosyl/mannosyltransferase
MAAGNVDVHYFYARNWSKEVRESPLRSLDVWKKAVKRVVPRPYMVSRAAQQAVFSFGARSRRLDVYHDPNYLAYRFDGPTVITAHDLSWIRYPETHPSERVDVFNHLFPRALERADVVITDADFVRREIIATFGVDPCRVKAIPLAARPGFKPHDAKDCAPTLSAHSLNWRHYLLCVGTLEPRKNLQLVLRAYATLNESFQKAFPLVVVGAKGWLTSELESLMAPLARNGSLRTLGYVEDEELARLYASARALIYPSLYEGFGLPPLEAMASGTPVIVSNASTMPEVVGEAGMRIEPMDESGLRDAMLTIAEDDTTWETMRAAGLAQAAKFSWQRCAQETLATYRQAIRNTR